MKDVKVGIVGAAGYTAGELIRLIINHPYLELTSLQSTSQSGKYICEIHRDLVGETKLLFSSNLKKDVDVIFLCSGHGRSVSFLEKYSPTSKQIVIDLGNDFRLNKDRCIGDRQFVYGLPELQKGKISKSNSIANPGCFATAIQLALLPLAASGNIPKEVHLHGITGSTGAGQSLLPTTHFSWRSNNISTYKVFSHQHLDEVRESLVSINQSFKETDINFVPVRGNFTRGIFVTAYWHGSTSFTDIYKFYANFYKYAKFTHLVHEDINLKQVVNTNKALISIQEIDKKIMVTSVIDNLLKGASGQALQNLNIILGFEEDTGLLLKANNF